MLRSAEYEHKNKISFAPPALFFDGIFKVTNASELENARGSSLPANLEALIGIPAESPDLLFMMTDERGAIRHFNQTCQEATGYTAQEATGKCTWEFLAVADHAAAEKAHFDNLKSEEHSLGFEAFWTSKTGEIKRIAWNYQRKHQIDGNNVQTVYVVCVGIMLPHLGDQAAMLRNSEARMAGIIATAMDAIITVDQGQKIVLFNDAAEKMFGYPASRAVGMPLDVLIPRRFAATHSGHLEHFGKSNATVRSMGHLRPLAAVRADGQEFPIEASISHIQIDGMRLYTAIVRDISERVKAERALQEAEARFRVTFDHVAIGILLIGPRWEILDANPATQAMLGYSLDELRGLPYSRIVHPLDVQDTVERIESVASGSPSSCEFEKRYVKKDGGRIWSRVIVSVVKLLDNEPAYFVTIVEDITWRKRAEARKRRNLAANAAAQQRLDRLTDRETQVMWLMVEGKPTKVIASDLGASPKTIDVHRKRVMEKMQAESVAQLVQMALPLRKKKTAE